MGTGGAASDRDIQASNAPTTSVDGPKSVVAVPAWRGFAALLQQDAHASRSARSPPPTPPPPPASSTGAAAAAAEVAETRDKEPAQALLSLLHVKRSAAASDSDGEKPYENDDEDDEDDDADDADDTSAAASAPPTPFYRGMSSNEAQRPKKKKRKSTHTARKQEEMAHLTEEIRRMSAKLAFLRGQVFAPGYAQHSPDSEGESVVVPPQVSNAVLRHSILTQQFHFASARSMMSQFIASDLATPLHSMIHLPRSPIERRAILLAVKPSYIDISTRFMAERCRFIDPLRPHACNERFVTPAGDACSIRFYVDQFDAALTVKDVFTAISYYMFNLELHITETAGHITIREDDDSGDPGMSQHRLVSTTALGAMIETNVVVFSQYDPEADSGICTATYVDRDDLHPYRPLERVRQDVTAVLTIARESGCVVLRRWAYVRVHHPRCPTVPRAAWSAIQETVGQWGDLMMQSIRQHLHIK
ncbi:hypothetical protein P43SY_001479 [Pythium insidiosum]|uniref:Uncharacterized protein n=1 Tax=Pythium insidiosum TaxID=114742 RepID=A0AAD5QCI3_PYTIN|nr:hypothetical protein P43SY_001479 [Pythium insidiosum]